MSKPADDCNVRWNVVTGCTPVSAGCDHCWARRFAKRMAGRAGYDRDDPTKPTFRDDRLGQPLKWKKPRVIAVGFMGDLFHEAHDDDDICSAFEVMALARQHIFLVLTKRPERIESALYGADGGNFLSGDDYLPNVWLGVSAEDQRTYDARVSALLRVMECSSGWHYWASIEPMLGPISIGLWYLDWVVVGGESGPGARYMEPDWARAVRDDCAAAGIPYYTKQMTAHAPIPEDLQVRQLPWGETG